MGLRRRRSLVSVFSASILGGALGLASAVAAQEVATPASDSLKSFPAAFFAPYNPITAADMVARTPGFELRDGDDRRGFGGSAGNLLVNGERPSSKTVASELLKRIPAGNVVRIELLSGSDAAADVRGQSQIVNVVVKQDARVGGGTTFVAGLRHIQYSNRIGWALQASRTLRLSPNADLSLDIQSPNTLGRGVITDRFLAPDGTLTGTRYQVNQANNMSLQGSAQLSWRPTSADTVNLNLQYVPAWHASDSVQFDASPAAVLRGSLDGRTEYDNNYSTEVGGDWEHRFSPALAVKLIGLVSNTSIDQNDRFDIFTAPATRLTRTQDRTTRNGERIGRLQVKWRLNDQHTLEFGGEGAFNFRETSLDIVNTPLGGAPVPIPLAVSDARVEEVRGEVFATDVWTISPKLTVEGGVNFELSRITQTGDQSKERTFRYLKPRASATYVVDERNTVRLIVLRDVAQLDFAEFSSAVDFLNTSTIQGNPDLVPQRAWKARIEWDRRFAGRGALTLAAFADEVQDVHDLIDAGGLDAYGNIGDGTRRGVEARATIPMAYFGLPNGELRLSGLYQQTRVTDPVTGERRSFSVPLERQNSSSGSATLNGGDKDWAYLVNYRHNLPDLQAAWGVTMFQWSGRSEYRRAELIDYVRPKPRIDLFVETTAIRPVTLRVYLNNILVSTEERDRTFFVGDRSTGRVQRIEERQARGGPEGSRIVGFQVSGRF